MAFGDIVRSGSLSSNYARAIGGTTDTIWHGVYQGGVFERLQELSTTDFSVDRTADIDHYCTGVGGNDDRIWGTSPENSGLVIEYDTSDLSLIRSGAAPQQTPTGCGGDSNYIWFCEAYGVARMYRLSPHDFSVQTQNDAPAGGNPVGIGGSNARVWQTQVTTNKLFEHTINFAQTQSATLSYSVQDVGGDDWTIWGCDYTPKAYEIDSGYTNPNESLVLEIAFDQSIFTVSPTWTDVSEYLRELHTERGRMHELDRIEAGIAFFLLDNSSGNFWRGNTAGDYYPDVKPLQLIRLRGVFDGTSYGLFYGIIESFIHKWQDEDAAYAPEVEVNCVDCFKSLARAKIIDANPDLTQNAGADPNKDVYVESVYGLVVGQSIKIKDDISEEVNTISAISNTDSKVTMVNALANAYTTANNAKLKKFPQVYSGTRITDVLLEWGWPSALTDIDTGQSEVIEHSPPAGGTNALQHIQDVAEAENGIFFQEGDGTLNFQDSIARQSSPYDTSQATFKDDGNDSRYTRPQISDDEEFIYNQADISGDGVGEQSVYDPDAQADQGPRALTRSDSQLADEMAALAQCFIFVQRYNDSILRPRQFVVKPEVNPTDLYPYVFGFDISTRITMELDSTRNPAELDRDYHIEGIQHDWTAQEDYFMTTWQLWETNQYRVIEIEHDGYLLNIDETTDYDACHDAASCSVPAYNDAGLIEVGQWDVYAGAIWVSSRIERGYLEFDTSGLSGYTVAAGWVFIKVYAPLYQSATWNLTLVDPDAIANPLVDTDYGDMETQQASLGLVTMDSDIVPFTWVAIPLNSSGISHVNVSGLTKFGVRSGKDISANAPGGNYQDWVTIFGKGSSYEPMLFVQLDL